MKKKMYFLLLGIILMVMLFKIQGVGSADLNNTIDKTPYIEPTSKITEYGGYKIIQTDDEINYQVYVGKEKGKSVVHISVPDISKYDIIKDIKVPYETLTETTATFDARKLELTSMGYNTSKLNKTTFKVYTSLPITNKDGITIGYINKTSNLTSYRWDYTMPTGNNNIKIGYNSIIIIKIMDAEHLNSSRGFISNVYDYVKERDYNYTLIQNGDYLRVIFERNLSNINDITIYAKSNSSSRIGVYENGGTSKIAEFTNITKDGMYRILLTNLSGTQNTFDLLSNGSIEYDYVVDPIDPRSYNVSITPTDDLWYYGTASTIYGSQLKFTIPNNLYQINDAQLCLYLQAISFANSSVSVWYINNETWLDTDATIPTETGQYDSVELASSITAETWTCINVTKQIQNGYFGVSNLTLRIESAKNLVSDGGAGVLTSVDSVGLAIGRTGPSQARMFFEDTENYYGTGNYPYLSINYSLPSECGTITTSYRLNNNITQNGSCFTIGGDNVVLDCAGYNVVGNKSGVFLSSSSYDNLTLKDCIVSNFRTGIFATTLTSSHILNNTFKDNYAKSTDGSAIYFIDLESNSNYNVIDGLRCKNNTLVDTGAGNTADIRISSNSDNNNLTDIYFNLNNITSNGDYSGKLSLLGNSLYVADINSFNNTIGATYVKGEVLSLLGGANYKVKNITSNYNKITGGQEIFPVIFNNGLTNIDMSNINISNNILYSKYTNYGALIGVDNWNGDPQMNITNLSAINNNITTSIFSRTGFISFTYYARLNNLKNVDIKYNSIKSQEVWGLIYLGGNTNNNIIDNFNISNNNITLTSTANRRGESIYFDSASYSNTINNSYFGQNNWTGTGISDINDVYYGATVGGNVISNSIFNSDSANYSFMFSNVSGQSNQINNVKLINNGKDIYMDNGMFGNILSNTNFTGAIDLTNGNGTISFYGGNYTYPINISNEFILRNNFTQINSSTPLNRTANITFTGMTNGLTSPIMARDGVLCNSGTTPACINYTNLSASIVRFRVSSWSSYSIIEGTTPPADTCIYSGTGNWLINCADNCTFTTNTAILTENITIYGAGTLNLRANWTFYGTNQYIFDGGGGTCTINDFSSNGIF